jgi:hypothetical protein
MIQNFCYIIYALEIWNTIIKYLHFEELQIKHTLKAYVNNETDVI